MVLTKKESILNEISELSPMDKADIVEKVMSSFEYPERENIDKIWAFESEKRVDDYLNGKIKTKSAKDVFASLDGNN